MCVCVCVRACVRACVHVGWEEGRVRYPGLIETRVQAAVQISNHADKQALFQRLLDFWSFNMQSTAKVTCGRNITSSNHCR